MTDDPIYELGDFVFGDDPFKSGETGRPWVIVSNHEGRPFPSEQYIALMLTTKSWPDGLVEIPNDAWLQGGRPEKIRIVPWGVQSLIGADMCAWQGRLRSSVVDQAVKALVEELEQMRDHSQVREAVF